MTHRAQREPDEAVRATPGSTRHTDCAARAAERSGRIEDVTNPRTPLASLSDDDLAAFLTQQQRAYAALQARGLKLDLTRGKPSAAQLDLSNDLLHLPTSTKDRGGVDVRNYGGLEGLAELRELFAELLWVEPAQVVAGGNSSLTMMYATIVDFLLFGGVDSARPWSQEERVNFICPVPGYDRHFSMLAEFGIEMVTVDMHHDGPDMAAVEALVRDDPSVKGIWIVPTYANPSGASRLAGERRAPGRHAHGGPRLHDLLGQRLRLPPPHRGTRPRAPTSSASRPPRVTRTGRSCTPRRRRSPSRAPVWPCWRRPRPSSRGSSGTSPWARSGPTR